MAKKQTPQNPLLLSHQAMLGLGLKKQPFTESILVADNVFTDAIFDQLVETLKHHLQFSDLLLIVEGNFGSGKTTLYRRLIQEDTPNLYILPVQAEATDTLVQLQQKISIQLKEQGSANYLDDNLKHLQVFDQNPVAIIDDAHVLSDITLQELLRYQKQLEAEKDIKLKLLLFANRGMARTLEQITDLQHNQLYVQDMPALTGKQIHAFISHKLRLAGYTDAAFLSEEQIKSILDKSHGLPADVMKQAVVEIEKWIRKQSRKGFGLRLSRPTLLAALLILAVVAAGALFFATRGLLQEQPAQVSTPLTLPTPSPSAPLPAVETPPEPEVEAELSLEAAPPIMDAEPLAEATAPVEAPVEPEPETIMIPEPTPAPIQPQITEPAVRAPEVPAVPMPAPVAPRAETPRPPPVPTLPERPGTPDTRTVDPALQELGRLGIKGPAWLTSRNPTYWTLQVLGAREPRTLVNFIKQHQLNADDTAWYVTDLNGKPWYVLLHNFYADQDTARRSINHLPAGVQQGKPWVKSMASVQKALKP